MTSPNGKRTFLGGMTDEAVSSLNLKKWYGIGKVTVSTFNEEAIDEKEWAKLRDKLFDPFIPISNHAFWEMMRYPSRFRADFNLLKMASTQQKWWYPRAERLLRTEVADPVKRE